MYMPHTVTVYDVFEDPQTFETKTNVTVLRGVFLDEVKAANVNKSGMESADAAVLYIPLLVDAEDGFTSESKTYIGWREYQKAQDKSRLWSLDTNGMSFFVKGDVVIANQSFAFINANYDNVYKVTKVDTKDFGSLEMRHLEVGGA